MAVADPVAIARHPHLGDECQPGWVRVDMHSHTLHSGDSSTTIDEIVEAVLESQIDVLCITDHNSVAGARQVADILEREGICRVITGEEVRTHSGEIIGLFLRDRISFGESAQKTAEAIREQGGLVYVPHPFDPMRKNITEAALHDLVAARLVDAVEAFNAKTSLRSLNRRAATFAQDHDLASGAGSDAHVPHAIGSAFVEIPDFDGPQDFLDALRRGRVVGHHWDKPRPWSSRIVPSIPNDQFNGD
jgi:predicted metal-dependent phosphoesterase TrpH